MATLYITEFKSLAKDFNGFVPQIGALPPNAEQTRTISGTSAQSAAFADDTKFIRLESDAICSVAVGLDPTATTSSMRLAADSPEYFMVHEGYKVAAITNT